MTTIGTAVLQIIPSLDGVSRSIDKQLGGTLGVAGRRGGQQFASGFGSGLKSLERDVDTAGRRAADALGKVRVAQAALNQARLGGNTARVVAAEERYNKALRDQGSAAQAAKNAHTQLSAAKSRVGSNLTGIRSLSGALTGVSGAATAAGGALLGLAGGALVGVAAAATGAVTALGGLALIKGFDRLKTIDDAKFKLQALGNSAADVQKIMDSALASVKGTSFGLGEAATVAASAVAAGVKPGQELTKYLTLTADSAAVAGTSLSDMGRIINQVRTGQKAYTEDLNQLADRGIPIYQYLSEQLHISTADVKQFAADGKISSADFEAAISKHIGGAALTMGQSFTGAVANAQAALGRLGAAFLAPVFGNAAGGIGSITDALDGVTNWIENNQDTIIGFWEGLGSAAITTADVVSDALGQLLQGVGQFIQPFGDIQGAVLDFQAWQASVRGDDETAAQLRDQAQAAYSWGEGLDAAGKSLRDFDPSAARDKLHGWADAARDAAAAGRNAAGELAGLGTALGVLPKSTNIDIQVNTAQAQQRINDFFNQNSNRTLPVAVNPNIPSTTGRNPLDVIAGRAGGGVIPGFSTRDDRLGLVGGKTLIGLAGGEGVVKASATRNLGGKPFIDMLNGFADGGVVGDAEDVAASLNGLPYIYGERDCSKVQSDVYAALTGKPVGPRYFTTESDFEALGFLPGSAAGAYNIGIMRGGGGQLSHMAGTLPNGVNFEAGGSDSTVKYGGSASGADAFPLKFYLPVTGGDPAGGAASSSPFAGGSAVAAASAAPIGPTPSSGASGGFSVPSSLPDLAKLGFSGIGKGVGTTSSGSDLSLFADAAGAAAGGQVASLLDVFGVGGSPPFLQAISKFVGGISIGGDGASLPLSATPPGIGSPPADANIHGSQAGQPPGVTYNITARDTEDAFVKAQRIEREKSAAKLNRF